MSHETYLLFTHIFLSHPLTGEPPTPPLGGQGHSRQPKEYEKGFTGMINRGKRILMLKLS